MSIRRIEEVEFGEELPTFEPDTRMENVRRFCRAAHWNGPRFTSHEEARKLGLPGAIVPGVMSQGFLVAMIHRWAENARIIEVDTVFRAPVLVDQPHHITAVVTEIDEASGRLQTDLTVTNDQGETRVFGTATIELAAPG